jgi:hypothetical protein
MILYAGGFPATVHAQAAFEYAAKAANSALSKVGEVHLGVCRLDSAVVTCIQRHYPREFYFGVLATCVVVIIFLSSRR